MVKGNRYIEYQGDFYIVVGIGFQTKHPYYEHGNEHFYECVILNERNLRALPSILAGRTINIYFKDAKEVTDKKTLAMLELFYG